ncbi:hypothetical protein, partial [Heyndrickxia faecalis]|uniref:hypothetical protein n=1 Tax=Heyndrickxia faecalis TaxID=2824910 RepID=UPI003D1E3677
IFGCQKQIGMMSGCSLFTKEVDYQKIADDLNKKNMGAILYAKNGTADYEETSIVSNTFKVKDKFRKEVNIVDILGTYNTNNNTAVGTGQRSYEVIDNPNTSKSTQVKETKEPIFHLKYLNNQYINANKKENVNVQFIFDKLQGIEKLKPDQYTYGLDEPPFVKYKLNEKEFKEILNDDLKIKYKKIKYATIFINLYEDKNKLYIRNITVGVKWENTVKNKKEEFVLTHTISPSKIN